VDHLDDAPPSCALDHLRIEQPWQWHPARFEPGTSVLTPGRLHPVTEMPNDGG
jgi:hypothetical protein